MKADLAARWQRQRQRLRRARDGRFDRQYLEQPLRRAGSLRHLTAGLRKRTECCGREHGVKDELAEPAGRHLRRQHILRADPKHDDDAGGNEENGDAR